MSVDCVVCLLRGVVFESCPEFYIDMICFPKQHVTGNVHLEMEKDLVGLN
jgi:hypothetical protein